LAFETSASAGSSSALLHTLLRQSVPTTSPSSPLSLFVQGEQLFCETDFKQPQLNKQKERQKQTKKEKHHVELECTIPAN
jgi:hypothetical protein